jgi:hypothetical protein
MVSNVKYSLILENVSRSDIQLLYEWLAANVSNDRRHCHVQWLYRNYSLPDDLRIDFVDYQDLIHFKLVWSDEYSLSYVGVSTRPQWGDVK